MMAVETKTVKWVTEGVTSIFLTNESTLSTFDPSVGNINLKCWLNELHYRASTTMNHTNIHATSPYLCRTQGGRGGHTCHVQTL